MEKRYKYELLVIDTDGKSQIKTLRAISYAISGSDSIWSHPKIEEKPNIVSIVDANLKVIIKKIENAESFTDLIEAVFLIEIYSSDYGVLEKIRYPFVLWLKKLGFSNIRVLTDDISTEIARKIYPIINNVENSLRRYIALFFTLKIGMKWFNVTIPPATQGKITLRNKNEQVFSKIIDTDITLIDFDDLGEIIYKQNTGFNKQEHIIDKIMKLENIDDVRKLQEDIQNNYNKYFKETFQTNSFERKWKNLFEIRNKVAHNNLFTATDLDIALKIGEELLNIIKEATKKIDSFKFSIEEQESILQATIDSEGASINNEKDESADLSMAESSDNHDELIEKHITQDELVKYLYQMSDYKYIGLKYFASVYLPGHGYTSIPVNYAVINLLKNKGKVEIYDIEEDGHIVKAIKIKN